MAKNHIHQITWRFSMMMNTDDVERADKNHKNDMKLTRDPRRLYEPQSRLMLISEQAFS